MHAQVQEEETQRRQEGGLISLFVFVCFQVEQHFEEIVTSTVRGAEISPLSRWFTLGDIHSSLCPFLF